MWNGSVNAAASTSSSSGGASNTPVTPTSANSAMPPNDWSRHRDDPAADPLLGALAGGVDDPAHVHAERERHLAHDARHACRGSGRCHRS